MNNLINYLRAQKVSGAVIHDFMNWVTVAHTLIAASKEQELTEEQEQRLEKSISEMRRIINKCK